MNGANGRDGSDGQNGTDGVSPAVTIGDITGGHSVTITDATHPLGQTFNVMNGQDGATGATGATGPAGPGLPAGGAMGQMIYKASNADYHTEWGDVPNASAITYDSTGRDYITAVNVQGAIDELDGECASLSNSLTQYQKKAWTHQYVANGKDGIIINDTNYSEVKVYVQFGTNPSYLFSWDILADYTVEVGAKYYLNGCSGGSDYHQVYIQVNPNNREVKLISWTFRGTEVTSACRMDIYHR